MNYALIENGIVGNIIWLYPGNAGEFTNAVPVDKGRPVAIGDSYVNGKFYRDGAEICTEAERMISEYDAALTEIATALGVNV